MQSVCDTWKWPRHVRPKVPCVTLTETKRASKNRAHTTQHFHKMLSYTYNNWCLLLHIAIIISKVVTGNLIIMMDLHASAGTCGFTVPVTRQATKKTTNPESTPCPQLNSEQESTAQIWLLSLFIRCLWI